MLWKRLQQRSSDSWFILVMHILLLSELWASQVSMLINAVFQSVSVDKISFLMHPSRKSANSNLLFRAQAGFIIVQLKTL